MLKSLTSRISPRVWRTAGVIALALALADAAKIAHGISAGLTGGDLQPYLLAARVVVSGHGTIYQDGFVYLPSSALLFTPVAHAGHALFVVMGYLYVAVLWVAVVVVARVRVRREWWLVVAAVVGLYVLRSKLIGGSAYFENLGLIMVGFAAPSLLLMGQGRWNAGCALLAVSILVKPMLVPLFLVPFLYRQWRPAVSALAAVVLLTLISAAVAPGGWHFLTLGSYVFGSAAARSLPPVGNLTVQSIGLQHGVGRGGIDAARLLIAAVAACVCLRHWRRAADTDPMLIGFCVLLAFILDGQLYEQSYGFMLAPLALVIWRVKRVASGLILLGTLLLFAPPPLLPGAQRDDALIWLVGTVLAFAGLAWAIAQAGVPEPAVAYDRPGPAASNPGGTAWTSGSSAQGISAAP